MTSERPVLVSRRWLAAYGLTALVFGFCVFAGLDRHLLWGDEAETAVLATRVLNFGVPRADDGMNVVALAGHEANAQGIWTWSPWLQEYVCAASLAVLGRGTVAARLPFALATFAAGLLLARLMFRVFRRHDLALLTLILFATSVPVLLHGRQCRYYALLMLSEVGILAGYWSLLRGRDRSGVALLGTMIAAQAYCNYLAVIPNALALSAAGLSASLRFPRVKWGVLASGALALALALPWLLYAQPWEGQSDLVSTGLFAKNLGPVTDLLNEHLIALPVLLAGIVALVLQGRRGSRDENWHLGLFMALLLSLWWLVLPMSQVLFLRYASPAFPVAAAFSALALTVLLRRPALRAAAAAVLALTNVAAFAAPGLAHSPARLAWTFPDYLGGFLRTYDERARPVVAFLDAHAAPGDVVAVPDPEFPLIFYNEKIRIYDTRLRDPALLGELPTWIFPRSATGVFTGKWKTRPPAAWGEGYDPVVLDVPDTPRYHSLPDPGRYQYETARGRESFEILARRRR